MNYDDITITRSRRKTLVLGIDKNLRVYVKAPLRCSDREIRKFIDSRTEWLQKHLRQMEETQARLDALPPLTEAELCALARSAREYIPRRTAFFAPQLGVDYGKITIRSQKTRWGSCSARGNLNFNCLLMLTPPEVIDYVVVHELCHRREMNHSPRFYALVASLLPDYHQRRQWLKENGGALMSRLEQME